MTEVWKPIVGYEDIYEVSDLGNVRRVWPFKSDGRRQTGGPTIHNDRRYSRVVLFKNDDRRQHMVHRLVMAAFVGPLPRGHQVNHKDGNKQNNVLSNLEYVTPQQDARHKYDVLKVEAPHGSKHHAAKVSEDDVFAIRALRRRGWKLKRLAEEFGLSEPTICWICLNKEWKHI